MKPILIYCSVPSREVGVSISRLLVEQSLVACAQLIPEITSTYRWENKICEEAESLLILKTFESNFLEIERLIKANHPYQIPEIIGIKTSEVNNDYKDWMKTQLKMAIKQ